MSPVPKSAETLTVMRRPSHALPNARAGIEAFLNWVGDRIGRPPRVLLPAYYGFSTNEGSGVMDPILNAGATPILCRVNRSLHVDLDDYHSHVKHSRPDVAMLIHYFGWPDPAAQTMADVAAERGLYVLEDEAHSLLTDLVGGRSGRFGHAAAASLHKTLPIRGGGLMLWNHAEWAPNRENACEAWNYDLTGIASCRVENARTVMDAVRSQRVPATLLREDIPEGVIPLNVPLIVDPDRRQDVYTTLNADGYGVVCLYHRLGEGISESDHPNSFWLSQRLVNLPVHQDLDVTLVPDMLARLNEVLTS